MFWCSIISTFWDELMSRVHSKWSGNIWLYRWTAWALNPGYICGTTTTYKTMIFCVLFSFAKYRHWNQELQQRCTIISSVHIDGSVLIIPFRPAPQPLVPTLFLYKWTSHHAFNSSFITVHTYMYKATSLWQVMHGSVPRMRRIRKTDRVKTCILRMACICWTM